jgi:hypothetical protein
VEVEVEAFGGDNLTGVRLRLDRHARDVVSESKRHSGDDQFPAFKELEYLEKTVKEARREV